MTDKPRLRHEQLEQAALAADYQGTIDRLSRQLADAKKISDKLVAATYAGAKDAFLAMGPIPKVRAPKRDERTRGPEVALWHLTDWQGGKLTTTYNSDVMRRRVMQFCDVAERLTEIHRADHPVRDAVVALGGDMIEGLFNFPTQPYEIDATLFPQFDSVSRLLIDTVRRALAVYENVTVIGEWGNHGRIGSKRAAIPRADNIDRMCYHVARMMLADEKRLSWKDCPEDEQRIEIGNYRALLIHGDEVGRTGYASPVTIVQHVAKWQSGAYPWQFRDAYVGHYHQHSSFALPNGLGSVYYTGSTESDNRYARDTMASSAVPSQRLNFVHPEAGRVTGEYKVWLT